MLYPILLSAFVLFLSGMIVSVCLWRYRRAVAGINTVIPFAVLGALIPIGIKMGEAQSVDERIFCCALPSFYANLCYGMDPLSLLFCVLLLITAGLFALTELRREPSAMMNGFQWMVYGGLVMSIFGVFISRDFISFLFFWELSTVTLFILMIFRNHEKTLARTGWLYLFFSHISLLSLIAAFSLISQSGSFTNFMSLFNALKGIPIAFQSGIFLLLLIGLGSKSGIFPFYFWLPQSYVHPPLPLSALVAVGGVNLGLYGFLRFCEPFLMSPQEWWGPVLLITGTLSVLSGSFSAVVQNDMKRMLGFTTLTYVGLILVAFGLAFSAAFYSYSEAVVLISAGILCQIISHSIVQPLLLLASQAAERCVHSGNMNHAGGLIKRLPLATTAYAVGALANSLLPPFSGFVAVMFILLGMVRLLAAPDLPSSLLLLTILAAVEFIVAMLILAMSYLKGFGLFFLGSPRRSNRYDSKPEPAMQAALWIQTALLLLMLLLLPLWVYILPPLVESMLHVSAGAVETILRNEAWIPILYVWSASLLLIITVIGIRLMIRLSGRQNRTAVRAWRGGFSNHSVRSHFSAYSFSKPMSDYVGNLMPVPEAPFSKNLQFPKKSHFEVRPDIVFQEWFFTLLPIWINRWGVRFQALEKRRIHFYILLIGITLLFLLGVKYL